MRDRCWRRISSRVSLYVTDSYVCAKPEGICVISFRQCLWHLISKGGVRNRYKLVLQELQVEVYTRMGASADL